jgi:hypothetical protein
VKLNAAKQFTELIIPPTPNVIGHQENYFIGKIHMRLAAGDAPVNKAKKNSLY